MLVVFLPPQKHCHCQQNRAEPLNVDAVGQRQKVGVGEHYVCVCARKEQGAIQMYMHTMYMHYCQSLC